MTKMNLNIVSQLMCVSSYTHHPPEVVDFYIYWMSVKPCMSQSLHISASQLIHHLVEENRRDNQEAQNPPIGVCKVSDTEILILFCNVDNFKMYDVNQNL